MSYDSEVNASGFESHDSRTIYIILNFGDICEWRYVNEDMWMKICEWRYVNENVLSRLSRRVWTCQI